MVRWSSGLSRHTVTVKNTGSNPVRTANGGLAQSVERAAVNRQVVGSSPSSPAIKKEYKCN